MREHIAPDRLVYTLEDPWPVGVLTGYVDGGGFVLEHVVAFDRRPLRLVRAGLAYAWARGWGSVTFHVPRQHPKYAGLVALGRRLGFIEYESDWWVAYKP